MIIYIIIIIISIIVYLIYFNYKKENFINKDILEGNWLDTCKVYDFRYPYVWALCDNDKGKQIDTSINLSTCYQNKIKNFNGNLECQ